MPCARDFVARSTRVRPCQSSRTPHAFLLPLTIAFLLLAAFALLLAAEMMTPPPISAPTSASVSETAPSSGPSLLSTTKLQTATTSLPANGTIDLVRLIYPPGSGGQRPAFTGILLITVESGSLRVRLTGSGQFLEPEHPSHVVDEEVNLQSGQGLLLPTTTAVALRNDSLTPTVANAVGMFPAERAAAPVGMAASDARPVATRWAAVINDGATALSLATSWIGDLPSDPVRLELWRLELPPRTTMSIGDAAEIVLAVEAGTMRLAVTNGIGWQLRADQPDQLLSFMDSVEFVPADGAMLTEHPHATVENPGTGPLLVLVLAFQTANEVVIPARTTLDGNAELDKR